MVSRGLRATRAIPAATTSDSNAGGHRLIVRDRPIQNGKLKSLKAHQTLADRGIRVRIELSTLQVTKELIERIVATLAIVRLLAIVALAQGIVDIAIRVRIGRLRRRMCLVVLRCAVSICRVWDTVHGPLEVVSRSSVACIASQISDVQPGPAIQTNLSGSGGTSYPDDVSAPAQASGSPSRRHGS